MRRRPHADRTASEQVVEDLQTRLVEIAAAVDEVVGNFGVGAGTAGKRADLAIDAGA